MTCHNVLRPPLVWSKIKRTFMTNLSSNYTTKQWNGKKWIYQRDWMSPKITEENGFLPVRNIERETWFLLIIYHLKSTFTNFHWFLTMDRHLNGAKKCFSSTIMIFCGTLQTFVQNHTLMWFRDDIFRITVDVFFSNGVFFLISSNVAVDLVADRRKKIRWEENWNQNEWHVIAEVVKVCTWAVSLRN